MLFLIEALFGRFKVWSLERNILSYLCTTFWISHLVWYEIFFLFHNIFVGIRYFYGCNILLSFSYLNFFQETSGDLGHTCVIKMEHGLYGSKSLDSNWTLKIKKCSLRCHQTIKVMLTLNFIHMRNSYLHCGTCCYPEW